MTHTPTPYRAFGPYANGYLSSGYLITTDYDVREPEPEVGMFDGAEPLHGAMTGFSKADAEFICRACNAHEELVSALRLTLAALEGKPCRQQAIDDARAALAKAEAPTAAEPQERTDA